MEHPVTFGIVTGQHHLNWNQIRTQWKLAEDLGFEYLYLFDHFTGLYGSEDAPCMEASTLLAALAGETEKPQIGVMVYGNTHRHPAILAKEIVTIDHLSGGRAVLGIGAGWNENEHRWYGLVLPTPGERVKQFDEALTIIDGLMTSDGRFSFSGDFYQIEDAPFQPKPVHGRIPVLIGGKRPKMLRVVAKHADMWDGGGKLPDRKERVEELKRACDEVGRDFDEIVQSQGFGADGIMGAANLDELITIHLESGVRHFHFDMPLTPEEQEKVREAASVILPQYRTT
jgi:alkanesulfonate monooxygenase SsuD/methylene tetrahydromethanopterin reductase-like flavin-dependent oxidoreductase (luciferase family)